MESSNEGRRKSIRLANKQEPIASTSTARMNNDEGKKKVLKKKVVSCAAGEKAMGISLILQCVISKMNVSTLKSARRLSKTWKVEADKEISRRGCFRIKFDPKTRPFNEGLKELEFSKHLPCFDFHLCIPGSEMKQVEKFLSLFGSQVKSLTLNSRIYTSPLSPLLVGLPNLEHLFLNSEFFENEHLPHEVALKFKIKGDLINMKHITYLPEKDDTIATIERGSKAAQIIDNAPNLLSINNARFSSDLLKANAKDASKWKGKIHLLKSFQFPCYGNDIEIYGNTGVQVESLSIKCGAGAGVETKAFLEKLLQSSQHTLTTLVTFPRFICLPKAKEFGPAFLPFQNLKILQIRIHAVMWNTISRNDFESKHLSQFGQEVFPNLTTVILEMPYENYYQSYYQVGDEEYSPFVNAIESVVNLELRVQQKEESQYWKVDEYRMLRLNELFPNVKHLKLKDSFQIPQILPLCFSNWTELESLEFHVNFMRQLDMENPYPFTFYFEAMKLYDNLDAVFTGLPLEMCERLRKAKPGKGLKKDVQVAQNINSEERCTNSLVFLKELKKLNIVFSDIRPGISETECPISLVSCLYAFKLMPNLRVRVLYDQNLDIFNPETRKFNKDQYKMKTYLEKLGPHCEIGHWESGGVASLINACWYSGVYY